MKHGRVARSGWVFGVGGWIAAGFGGGPAWCADAPAAPAPAPAPVVARPDPIDLARILDAEWRRAQPSLLEPFLARPPGTPARRRAILALGRIGGRADVEARLRALLAAADADLDVVARAAGLSERPALVFDLLPHLPRSVRAATPATAAVLTAVGRLKDARASGFVRPWTRSQDPAVARAAFDALMRLGDDTALDDALAGLGAADAGVRRAAAFATWRLVGERRKAHGGDAWPGDPAVAASVAAALGKEADLEVRLALLRALCGSTPRAITPADGGPAQRLFEALRDPSPHVAADVAFRLGALHEGAEVVEALGVAAGRPEPLVREAALDGLAAQKDDAGRIAYAMAMEAARDDEDRAAVRALSSTWVEGLDPPPAPPASATTAPRDRPAVRRWLRSLAREATEDPRRRLRAYLARADLPASLRAFVLELVTDVEGGDWTVEALAAADDADVAVRAAGAVLLLRAGKDRPSPDARARLEAAVVRAFDRDASRDGADARAAIAEAVAAHAPAGGPSPAMRALLDRAFSDPVATVRRAAREALGALAPTDPRLAEPDPVPNDWKGLPRPKAPLLGMDLTAGGPWLSAAEVLTLCDAIDARGAVVHLETSKGRLRLRVHTAETPAHAANVVLAAAAGVYDGTPWHRVVPAFVIQGGDPRGDGSGDAGYSLPDEITETAFDRGVLGMPKSTKDTGGCQLFVMHVAAPHLDGGYTAYGEAADAESRATVDAIGVGDRIVRAWVEDRDGARFGR